MSTKTRVSVHAVVRFEEKFHFACLVGGQRDFHLLRPNDVYGHVQPLVHGTIGDSHNTPQNSVLYWAQRNLGPEFHGQLNRNWSDVEPQQFSADPQTATFAIEVNQEILATVRVHPSFRLHFLRFGEMEEPLQGNMQIPSYTLAAMKYVASLCPLK